MNCRLLNSAHVTGEGLAVTIIATSNATSACALNFDSEHISTVYV